MKSSSSAAMYALARRRQRLIADYQYKTRAKWELHSPQARRPTEALSLCFEKVRRQFLPHYFWSPPRWRIWIRKLVKKRVLPDFCIIGPLKSGTSDLAVTMMSHPNVLPPLIKEFTSSDPQAWRAFYPTLRQVEWHRKRHGITLCPLVGPYLHSLEIPVTLAALRPDTKVIIALRNPVDVVFSAWKWTVLHNEQNVVNRVPFLASFAAYVDEALVMFHEAPGPFTLTLQHGIYARSVTHWLRAFGKHNVQIFDIGEYFSDRDLLFRRFEEFLGLPHVQLPQQLPIANRSPLERLALDAGTSAKLRTFFEPYNRHLWDVIGTTFPW